jgi:hypothetical protein
MYIVVLCISTMSKFHLPTEGHERSYLMGELGSLGLSPIRINQLTKDSSNNNELRSLVQATKDSLLWEFNDAHK